MQSPDSAKIDQIMSQMLSIQSSIDSLYSMIPNINPPESTGGGSGIDLSKLAFGIKKRTSSQFIMNPGFVSLGNRRVGINELSVGSQSGSFFLILKIDRASLSASWLAASAIPADTPQNKYVAFYQYEGTASGRSRLKYIHHIGSVHLL